MATTGEGKKGEPNPSDVPANTLEKGSGKGSVPWTGLPDSRPEGGSNLKG